MDNCKEIKPVPLKMKFLPCCCSYFFGKCSEMDSRTIKLALNVIEKNSILKSQDELYKNNQRLDIIENKLDRLLVLLQDTKSS